MRWVHGHKCYQRIFFLFRHLRIFAHQKDKIIRIQNEEYTQLLHYCSY